MKKILSAIIILCAMITVTTFAANYSIDNITNSLWLDPTANSGVIDNIKEENNKKMQQDIDLYLITPGTYRQKIGISADDETMKEQVKKNYEVYPNNILKVYYLNKNEYAKQYADANCLEYLISDDYFLIMKGFNYKIDFNRAETVTEWPRRYGLDGTVEKYEQFIDVYGYSGGLSDGYDEFLENGDAIKNILKQKNISQVKEMKVVVTGKESTCLYIKALDAEYLIRLYTGQYYNSESDNPYNKNEDWVAELGLFKLYDAKDFFGIVAEEMNEMNEVKPTYETEAVNLQENGLLYGNENGLDLLKPLTRIEAATMLLRALGKSTESEAEVQTFEDVPQSHWGYGAAENAYSSGLIKGVGNDMFAPDDMVTGAQFATMVLRAGKHAEFNWEEALDILINEGVISAEEASTMDFFTRGDMAKIIYESIEKGLF